MSNIRKSSLESVRWFGHGMGAFAMFLVVSFWSTFVIAGMPDFTPDETTRRLVLTDAGRLRYEAVSFFLVVLLLSAVAVRFLWNRLGKDFAFLPRLSLGKALGIVMAWGLLVLVVLTMIALAREMMTPGSWRKQGLLYTLDVAKAAESADGHAAQAAAAEQDALRRKGLEDLKDALWEYAAAHHRKLPPADDSAIPRRRWQVPESFGARYGYVAGLSTADDSRIVAFEPALHGEQRFVLRVNGRIELLSSDAIRKQLTEAAP